MAQTPALTATVFLGGARWGARSHEYNREKHYWRSSYLLGTASRYLFVLWLLLWIPVVMMTPVTVVSWAAEHPTEIVVWTHGFGWALALRRGRVESIISRPRAARSDDRGDRQE